MGRVVEVEVMQRRRRGEAGMKASGAERRSAVTPEPCRLRLLFVTYRYRW